MVKEAGDSFLEKWKENYLGNWRRAEESAAEAQVKGQGAQCFVCTCVCVHTRMCVCMCVCACMRGCACLYVWSEALITPD